MDLPALSEDYCRCGHVASAHTDGAGPCRTCREAHRWSATWTLATRCVHFTWNETWEPVRRTA